MTIYSVWKVFWRQSSEPTTLPEDNGHQEERRGRETNLQGRRPPPTMLVHAGKARTAGRRKEEEQLTCCDLQLPTTMGLFGARATSPGTFSVTGCKYSYLSSLSDMTTSNLIMRMAAYWEESETATGAGGGTTRYSSYRISR